jgi:hypothetical protein
VTALTNPRSETRVAGECRIGEHEFCDGNQDVVAGGVVAVQLRCACSCHRKRQPGS